MLKYVDAKVTFAEIPNEICLCINFSNCKLACKGCHSKYLWEDVGTILDAEELYKLIDKNEGVTCICLMGGDSHPDAIESIAMFIKKYLPQYKVAWYSGGIFLPPHISLEYFDYIKVGRYMEEKGGLDSPTTNQRLYKIENITHEFWHNKP